MCPASAVANSCVSDGCTRCPTAPVIQENLAFSMSGKWRPDHATKVRKEFIVLLVQAMLLQRVILQPLYHCIGYRKRPQSFHKKCCGT